MSSEVETPPDPAAQPLTQLTRLVGAWRDAENPTYPLRIRFTRKAGGTVLAESSDRAGKPHSLTLYHSDGDTLLATHYCPQGNQPRLQLTGPGPTPRFTFRDATDLSPGESHLHALAFDLADPARPRRTETYRQGNEADTSVLTLVRVD